jgi:basic membrane protein A
MVVNKMKKKFLALVLCGMMATLSLAGCGSSTPNTGTQTPTTTETPGETGNETPATSDLKVGMVTDAGTIDDKSFNQGTWEGILKAETAFGVDKNYLQPAGTTEADYLTEIGNLYDAGYKFIVTPGFKFETAIFKAQERYQDAKFVLIDGAPLSEAGEYVVADNTVAIYFAEHEAGFLAGVAAALEQQDGDMGFIGGMEIPAVQKFNWGFQQGVSYANETLGTSITMQESNIVYQGSFDNVPAGQQLAAQMYDRGVKTIFCAAGGVGAGAITEAVERAKKGEEVWIVGVDIDQYADGIYDDTNSIVLTSAMKKVDAASFDMIAHELEGTFPGGQTIVIDAKIDGVGIPTENPNLSEATVAKVNELLDLIKSGALVVADTNDGSLIK